MIKVIYKIISIFLAIIISCTTIIFSQFFIERKYIYKTNYYEIVKKYTKEYDIDIYLIFSLIKAESNFKEKATSKKGAMGLMQIIPSTAKFVSEMLKVDEYDMFLAEDNIRFGCKYLSYLYDKYNITNTVLACYNAGEGNVCRWLKDEKYSIDGKVLIDVPYRETSIYIDKVNKNLKKYRKLYPDILDK